MTTLSEHPNSQTGTSALWDPINVGDLTLGHRLAMAPMSRDRSRPDGVPTELNVTYYAQRASTALIITEGTQPSADGQGYLLTPGIYTDEQIEGWRQVTDAVHEAGGQIVIQLMHVGRSPTRTTPPTAGNPSAPPPSHQPPRCSPQQGCRPSRSRAPSARRRP